ncbi:MAG: SAM-dependent methyltransferase [Candidatus Dadabacteria bacterium]
MHSASTRHPSSYRDPSGFLFHDNGVLYRQVNQSFRQDFDLFNDTGLYNELANKQLLISHREIEGVCYSGEAYKTIEPEVIPFISYPYEWCFDMLKDAALVTLDIAMESMQKGMLLKDASSYNVQWHKGKMMFIDTLSFEKYDEKEPWIAYRQFSEHFLAPLALMHYLQVPLQNILVGYSDGIPLSITKKLLPFKSRFTLNTYLHLHLQASEAGKRTGNKNQVSFSKTKLSNILKSLKEAINSYSFSTPSGVWSNYYEEARERQDYVEQKKSIISEWIKRLNIEKAIDLGANEGEFSFILSGEGAYTISADLDHYSINRLYKKIKQENISNIHPLLIDLSSPSPAIGLNNMERASFIERTQTDLVLALALVHHLAIGKNIPFEDIAIFFRSLGKKLIIEFMPKEDDKVKWMLQQKRDIYDWYSKDRFLGAFNKHYKVADSKIIGNSNRTLFLMEPLYH